MPKLCAKYFYELGYMFAVHIPCSNRKLNYLTPEASRSFS